MREEHSRTMRWGGCINVTGGEHIRAEEILEKYSGGKHSRIVWMKRSTVEQCEKLKIIQNRASM